LDGIAERGQNVGIDADLERLRTAAAESLWESIAQQFDDGGDPRAPSCFAHGRSELASASQPWALFTG
jgi:hypothetical protein